MKKEINKKHKLGFTLIELLVVVLIIGILAGIALPQYRLIVEKARMTEAIMLAHKIAEMHQNYYMITGSYLGSSEIDKLDITIPGSKSTENRLVTKYFIYSPTACINVCDGTTPWLAFVKRIKNYDDLVNGPFAYSLYIEKTNPNKIVCSYNSGISPEQTILCDKLNEAGTLE